jgi:hypothetical protein
MNEVCPSPVSPPPKIKTHSEFIIPSKNMCPNIPQAKNVMWDQMKNYNVPSILQADPTSPSVHPSTIHPNRFNMTFLIKRTHEVPQKNQLIVHNNTKFPQKPTWFTLTNAEFGVCFFVHFCEGHGLAIIHPEEE